MPNRDGGTGGALGAVIAPLFLEMGEILAFSNANILRLMESLASPTF